MLLSLSPLSHHIAWVGIAQWLLAGCLFVTNDPPAGTTALDWIIETGATYVMGVPTHAMDVLAQQKARGRRTARRASRCSTWRVRRSRPRWRPAFVAQGIQPQNIYGMTENSSHQYTHPDDDDDDQRHDVRTRRTGLRGAPVRSGRSRSPGCDRRGGRDRRTRRRADARLLRQPGGHRERASTATAGSCRATSGVLDEHGNLESGRAVEGPDHPRWPQHLPGAHRGAGPAPRRVARVACFPVADERLGERVCIAVTGSVVADELLAHLGREGLSRYDMPEFFVRLDEFPLTASGKILKRNLVEMVKRGELAPVPVRFQTTGRGRVMSVELFNRDECAVLVLNRPEALNALSFDIIRRIGAAFDEVASSKARALIVTGAGPKAFCAGADIKELRNRDLVAQKRGAELGQAVFAKLDTLPMPSIAVINGFASAAASSWRSPAPSAWPRGTPNGSARDQARPALRLWRHAAPAARDRRGARA